MEKAGYGDAGGSFPFRNWLSKANLQIRGQKTNLDRGDGSSRNANAGGRENSLRDVDGCAVFEGERTGDDRSAG